MYRIRTMGYDAVHPSDFVYEMPASGDSLLILTATPVRCFEGKSCRVLPPPQAALFLPGSGARYGADGEPYQNDWMIFSSDETAVTGFPLVNRFFPVSDPEYCHSLFRLLTWEWRQDGGYETVISQLMSVLFHRLAADLGRQDSEPYGFALDALRRRIGSEPHAPWTVAGMARELHISEGYLQALYKRRFGVSCMEDVIRARLRLAEDCLTHTVMSVAEIAVVCGYHSTEHFSRQFRRFVGIAPLAYRRGARPDRPVR